MGAALWLTFLLAAAAQVLVIALRLTSLDERWLPAIRATTFTGWLRLAAVPFLLTAAFAVTTESLDEAPIALVWIVVALAGAAAYLTVSPSPPSVRGNRGADLRLASCNIERDSPAAGAIARSLLDLDADVLLLQEYTPATAQACHGAGLPGAYPHVLEDPEEGWFGSAIFSRHPISVAGRPVVGQRPMTITTLEIGDRKVLVGNVHTQAPIYRRDVTPWRTAFAELADLAEQAATTGTLTVLAGDWNATFGHHPMQRLLRTRLLVDAHRAARRIPPRTWPTDRGHPPLVCLDHVLITPTIEVTGTTELRLDGTDHKAITVSLRLPG